MSRIWSAEQEAIFDWFAAPTKATPSNLVVRARAGCGKTTTITEGIKRAPELRKWVGAFGKKNKEDLEPRFVGTDVKVQTFHSLGCGYVLGRWSGIGICNTNERAERLTDKVIPTMTPDDVRKQVTKLHTKVREICPRATTVEEIFPLAVQFECEPDDEWRYEGYDTPWVCQQVLYILDVWATTKPIETGIDYADMIGLPVRNRWMRPRFDLAVADEAQDLTSAQLELMIGSVARGGRICIVGDDRQAIYAFRGADVGSLDRLKSELNATELGLKTTYRCGKSIVNLAAEIVPDFIAAPGNPAGEVSSLPIDKLLETVEYGDFILSRANAPLLPTAMALLRAGRRARVAGKNIGDGLKAVIKKVARGEARNSVPAFINRLGTWKSKQLARAMAIENEYTRQSKCDFINDQYAMLAELADGAVSVGAIDAAIDALFTDNGLGDAGVVTLSSVHRAKGLEADRVFILADTLKYGSTEEDNIRYVAITRAKRELVFVDNPAAKKEGQ